MSKLRSEQLIEYAKSMYAAGKIDVDDLEQRIHRALTGEATDAEWIEAARYHQFTQPITGLGDLKTLYVGPIPEPTTSQVEWLKQT